MNAIWIWDLYDATSVANACIAGKIDILLPLMGVWNTDGTINYTQPISTWKNWVTAVKSINPNFKVLGCIQNVSCFWAGQPVIDITPLSMRISMVNNMINAVNSIGLDGINEDYECTPDTSIGYSSLIDLWNRMGTAMRSMGKISSACTMNWGAYITQVSPSLNIDYLLPMCYNGGGWGGTDLQNCIHSQLVASKSPLIIGLAQYAGVPLVTQISVIDAKLQSEDTTKLRGFSIFEYGTMSASDWNVWNSWKTKDKYACIPSQISCSFTAFK